MRFVNGIAADRPGLAKRAKTKQLSLAIRTLQQRHWAAMTTSAKSPSPIARAYALTGTYQPPPLGSFDDDEPRVWLEIETQNKNPRLHLAQIDLTNDAAAPLEPAKGVSEKETRAPGGVVVLVDDKLGVLREKTLFAASSMAPLLPSPLAAEQKAAQGLLRSFTSSIDKMTAEKDEQSKRDAFAEKEFGPLLNLLAPLLSLLPSRLFLVGALSKKAIRKRTCLALSSTKTTTSFDASLLQEPVILSIFPGHDDDVGVYLALDEQVWVQLAGPMDAANSRFADLKDSDVAGLLFKPDVVLCAPGFTSWNRSREEREAHIRNASRLLSRSRLQDAAFALFSSEPPLTTSEEEHAFDALLLQIVPAEASVVKVTDELQEMSNLILKNRIRRREQGVLHWSHDIVFDGIEMLLTLVSSTGAQIDEALLSIDGHLVRAGLRPQPRSILRVLKELASKSTLPSKMESEAFAAATSGPGVDLQARVKGER